MGFFLSPNIDWLVDMTTLSQHIINAKRLLDEIYFLIPSPDRTRIKAIEAKLLELDMVNSQIWIEFDKERNNE